MPTRATSTSKASSSRTPGTARRSIGDSAAGTDQKRILVIGGTQFIGKLLVEKLSAAGHEVHILHRKPKHSFSKRVHNLCADRNDAASIRKAVGATRFDAVYDIAYDWERGTTGAQIEATAQIFDGKRPNRTGQSEDWGEDGREGSDAGEDGRHDAAGLKRMG